jgi:hypothetical protein
MNLIKNQIEKSYKKNELVCICLNRIDWDNRVIGHVKNIYASGKFDFEIIDEFGQKRNKKTFLFNSIKSLELGGIYNKNLDALNKNGFLKNQQHPKYYKINRQSAYTRLIELKASQTLCTFFFKNEYAMGKVKKVAKDEFFIANIGYDGIADGISIFDITLLTKIRCNTNFENRISFLNAK